MIVNRWISRERMNENPALIMLHNQSFYVQHIHNKPFMKQLWNIELFMSDSCPSEKAFLWVTRGGGEVRLWVTEYFLLPVQRFLSFLPWLELPLPGALSLLKVKKDIHVARRNSSTKLHFYCKIKYKRLWSLTIYFVGYSFMHGMSGCD